MYFLVKQPMKTFGVKQLHRNVQFLQKLTRSELAAWKTKVAQISRDI